MCTWVLSVTAALQRLLQAQEVLLTLAARVAVVLPPAWCIEWGASHGKKCLKLWDAARRRRLEGNWRAIAKKGLKK